MNIDQRKPVFEPSLCSFWCNAPELHRDSVELQFNSASHLATSM